MPALRILVVDDYEPFRRVVRLILQLRDDLRIVGEASDGLEAVQKAKELQPDLILLDVALPRLNGIQAARRLRDLVPDARVLFLSVESSSDVVREALNLGAVGYVHKLRVASELTPAIETVLKGKKFVGSGLEGAVGENTASQAPPHRHEMLIYSDDTVLLDAFTRFIAVALRADKPVITAPTKSHLDRLLESLNAEGLDIDAAIERGSFIAMDATDKLSALMVNDLPDRLRWLNAMSGLVEAVRHAKEGHSRIALCGECTPLLLAQGNAEGAIRLEQLCNNLADTHEFDILCAYPLSSFQGEQNERAFKTICAEHTTVYSR
jgi:DNA-binding NarL/FixJ family response regulator